MVDEGARATRPARGQDPILPPTAGEKRMAAAPQARPPAAAAAKRPAIGVPGDSAPAVSASMEIEMREIGGEEDEVVQVPEGGMAAAPGMRSGAEENGVSHAGIEAVQNSSKGDSKQESWFRLSVPANFRIHVSSWEAFQAVEIALLEMTDKDRLGGPVQGIPEVIYDSDTGRKDGPYDFALAGSKAAANFVSELKGVLMVESKDGEQDITCNLHLNVELKDRVAAEMADALGFWGLVFLPKGKRFTTKLVTHILTHQLQVWLLDCKPKRAKRGQANTRGVIEFKAIEKPGTPTRMPPFLMFDDPDREGLKVAVRYRVSGDYFPSLCGQCHYNKDSAECLKLHKKMQEIREFNETGRRKAAEREAANRAARDAAAEANARLPVASTTAARIAKQRDHKAKQARAAEKGICPNFAFGNLCPFAAANCPKGKHTEGWDASSSRQGQVSWRPTSKIHLLFLETVTGKLPK